DGQHVRGRRPADRRGGGRAELHVAGAREIGPGDQHGVAAGERPGRDAQGGDRRRRGGGVAELIGGGRARRAPGRGDRDVDRRGRLRRRHGGDGGRAVDGEGGGDASEQHL